ncbi:hypothetical protein BGX27_010429 [Mortierella sp. AM989]|nr:hypothetical protein BGX27_010429 [Mortierella sp. AM989]
MSSNTVITASYSVASQSMEASTTDSASTLGPLSFEAPILLTDPSNDAHNNKEQYLTALAAALSTLQDTINTGLTERLIQQGVLSETTDVDPSINTKLRTKVPGQPNNSKKGQTKKQQQREQKQKSQEQQDQSEAKSKPSETTGSEASTSVTPALEIASLSPVKDLVTPMEVDPSSSAAQDDTDMQEDSQYRPKGGIYGDDEEDEDKQGKDEVDLLMEADPGEVEGACLELPKDQPQSQQQQETHNKKRNEIPDTASSLAAAKKSRGSGDE